MEQALRLFLLQQQDTEGTPETDLTAADLFDAEPGSKIEPGQVVTEIETVGGGYRQDQPVVGKLQCAVTLIAKMRPFGVSDAQVKPDWVSALECARFAVATNAGYYICTPSSTVTKDCTVWEYSGNLAAASCLLRKAGNVKFDWKMNFDFSGDSVAQIELTGPGKYTKAANGTQPTVTRNRTAVPPLKGVTMQINGDSDYRALSLEIAGNQGVELTTKPSDASGTGKANVTTRKIKWSAKVYQDITTVTDPETALEALTEDTLSLSFGTNTGIVVSSTKSQITKVSQSDENGVQTYDLEGTFNDNDFTLRVLGADSSSSSSSSSSA